MALRQTASAALAALLVVTAACGPEITNISPTRIRSDGVVVVEGKGISDRISVSIAGGPIPVSDVEIIDGKENIGRFSFRMPSHDVKGWPLSPGAYQATIAIGGTTERRQLELTARDPAPRPAASQVSAVVTPAGEGALEIEARELRWPLKIRVVPIVPHGPELAFSKDAPSFETTGHFVIPLPPGAIQLSSYRVYFQNSTRYGGQWSEPAVAVYKP
jgi:hypothetical protein